MRGLGRMIVGFGALAWSGSLAAGTAAAADQVKVTGGIVEGVVGTDASVRAFRGIPFAAPPDCLYLNVWTTAESADAGQPVLVVFHGGGFAAGSGSEPRTDGEWFARQGIVVVEPNYRLGVFGFLAHPELSAESDEHG